MLRIQHNRTSYVQGKERLFSANRTSILIEVIFDSNLPISTSWLPMVFCTVC